MMHARVTDLEPGFVFRSYGGREAPDLVWVGVDHVASRFAGKSRVRVLARTRGGEEISFVCDRELKVPVLWAGGR